MVIFAAFALAAIFSVLLWSVSGYFRPRFAGRDRLVMQWSLTGKPTWRAPKRVALAFTPALGTLVLFFTAGLVAFGTPNVGQAAALSIIVLLGLVFAAIHAGHMTFAERDREE